MDLLSLGNYKRMSVRLCTELFYCGVGTVLAVEALVATLFSPILIFVALT